MQPPPDEAFVPDLPPEAPAAADSPLRERYTRELAEGVADLELAVARHRRWIRITAIACLFPPTLLVLLTLWFFGRAALRAHHRALVDSLDLRAEHLSPDDVCFLAAELERLRI